jgi:beta-lactamase regulating signal transducer with metallopeptidase domain
MEMGRLVLEYCLNAVWLVPAVAGAAWLLVRVARLEPAGEHRVWLGALAVCLALPAVGMARSPMERSAAALGPSAVRLSIVPIPSDTVEPAGPAAVQPIAPMAQDPGRREGFVRSLRELPMSPRLLSWFGWAYAAVVGFAAFRLARVWLAARRLVREASPYAMAEAEDSTYRELGTHFGVKIPPVLHSRAVRSPVVVGVRRTLLLLPEDFAQYPQSEQRAAICHELAHVRRRDCLVHAGVQVLMLPLIWHPAAHFAARRIARTREMACDEMAAAAMTCSTGELDYARCLLSLARRMVREQGEPLAGVGLGLFRTNKLEERVMRLTEAKQVLGVRARLVRRVGGVALAGAVLVGGALVHVAPLVAQQGAPAAPVAPSVRVPQPAAETAAAGTGVGAGDSFGADPGDSARSQGLSDDHGVHVIVNDGTHIHRWVGANGERYEVRDAQAAPYTKQQQRAAEAEFDDRLRKAKEQLDRADIQLNGWKDGVQIDERTTAAMAKAAAELAQATAQFNSPELKKQMANAAAELAAAKAQFNSPAFKQQMAELNSPRFKAQMDELQAQIAQIDTKAFRDATGQLVSAEVEKNLARAEEQAARVDTPAMEQKLADAAKRLDAASARLEAATKALAEAQKRLEAMPAK